MGWQRIAAALALVLVPEVARAGPPFITDDPEPVEYRHWEFYLATQHLLTADGAIGTAPHVEINYGAIPNLQLHLIAPLAYAWTRGGPLLYGPGDVELGAKLRFVQEGTWIPMVGTFPQLELPVGNASRGLGAGTVRAFFPLWLQKSFGDWTSYGGGGLWLNPGAGNRNFWYFGWQVQRRLSDLVVLGGEAFYTTPDRVDGSGDLRFNLGLILDLSELHHLMVSAGRSIVGDSLFQGYLAYLLTL